MKAKKKYTDSIATVYENLLLINIIRSYLLRMNAYSSQRNRL